MISVRTLAPRDFAQVVRINTQNRPNVAPLDDAELERLTALPNHHLVAEGEGGMVVGYVLAFGREAAYDGEEFLAFRASTAETYVYIDQVAVARESTGIGVGRALYTAIESAAAAYGACSLCCEVNTAPPNPGSMAFHRKMGFHPIGSLATLDGREVALLVRKFRP